VSHLIRSRLVFFSNNRHNPFLPCQAARVLRGSWRTTLLTFALSIACTKRKEPNKLAPAVVAAFIFHISNTLDLYPSPVNLPFACLRSCKYTCFTKLRTRLISDLSPELGNSSGTLSENGFSANKPKFTEWIVPTMTRRTFIFIEPPCQFHGFVCCWFITSDLKIYISIRCEANGKMPKRCLSLFTYMLYYLLKYAYQTLFYV